MPCANQAVVACARSWIGTRFHHQGRLKKTLHHKGGVDCLGLLVGVADEMGLCDRRGACFSLADEVDYSHLPDLGHLRAVLERVMRDVPMDEKQVGDVLLLDVDGRAQHLAILSDWQGGWGMIHAYAPARGVVEHGLDAWWQNRIRGVFRIAAE